MRTNIGKTATNFDLPSLHILHSEINSVLKDAELHLRDFYDDPDQVDILEDSANNMAQLASIFKLISFDGASELADLISKSYAMIHQNADEENEPFMTDVSEAIMLLDRYVEFILLKEMPEPALLLPIINKLNEHLGLPALTAKELKQKVSSVIISDPKANYVSLNNLNLNHKALISAYRAGLSVVLENKGEPVSQDDLQKLQGMEQACQAIAQQSDTLFWQSAAAITKNIAQDLPLSHPKKRILVYLEQQFSDYLPIEDRRFAEMVSMACSKNDEFANLATQKYELNQVSQTKFEEMQRFLFGPNREITDTLNGIIQEQIETIKQKVDKLVRNTNEGEKVEVSEITTELSTLSMAMELLELKDASTALKEASAQVAAWNNPTLEELDLFLDKLLIAENASIFLAKTHTPGAVKLPLHNREISLHQLDTSYETLIKEARANLTTASLTLNDYLTDSTHDIALLQNMAELMRQVAGAAAFLRLSAVSTQLYILARKLETGLLDKINAADNNQKNEIANAWADVVVAADVELESFEENRPSSEQVLALSQSSLNQLIA